MWSYLEAGCRVLPGGWLQGFTWRLAAWSYLEAGCDAPTWKLAERSYLEAGCVVLPGGWLRGPTWRLAVMLLPGG